MSSSIQYETIGCNVNDVKRCIDGGYVDINEMFLCAAGISDAIDTFEYIFNAYLSDANLDYQKAFEIASEKGNFNVVKFFIDCKDFEIKLDSNDNYAIRKSSQNLEQEVIKPESWLDFKKISLY